MVVLPVATHLMLPVPLKLLLLLPLPACAYQSRDSTGKQKAPHRRDMETKAAARQSSTSAGSAYNSEITTSP